MSAAAIELVDPVVLAADRLVFLAEGAALKLDWAAILAALDAVMPLPDREVHGSFGATEASIRVVTSWVVGVDDGNRAWNEG